MDKLLRLDEYFRVSTFDFVFLSFCYGIYIYKKNERDGILIRLSCNIIRVKSLALKILSKDTCCLFYHLHARAFLVVLGSACLGGCRCGSVLCKT